MSDDAPSGNEILSLNDAEAERVNALLAAWRQGDAALDAQGFLFVADLNNPLSPAAYDLAELRRREQEEDRSVEGVTTEVDGFVVISQTCDIVRDCRKRPYVQVASLVQVSEADLREVQKLRRPGLVIVPSLVEHMLVGDLDRVMTVEKPVLANWTRIEGCRTTAEIQKFARALARKLQRFAFPNDFVQYVRPLEALLKVHGKASGAATAHVECLDEVRVAAFPDWNAGKIELQFIFIKDDEPATVDSNWSTFANQWMRELGEHARYSAGPPLVGYLRDFDAETYLTSNRLDLEALSPPGPS